MPAHSHYFKWVASGVTLKTCAAIPRHRDLVADCSESVRLDEEHTR
jgi:hypothetical protein